MAAILYLIEWEKMRTTDILSLLTMWFVNTVLLWTFISSCENAVYWQLCQCASFIIIIIHRLYGHNDYVQVGLSFILYIL